MDLIIWNTYAIFKIAAFFQHDCHMPCICICPGVVVVGVGGRGYSEEFWQGCAARVVATIPFAMETESQNHTLGNGKWVKIKPLTIGNVTKLTTFEAILDAIGQIWPKSCHSLRKNGGIRSKYAENISLATEARPKLDPWLRKSSQKYGYGNWAQKGTLAGSTPQ